jgi:hypothetical protein
MKLKKLQYALTLVFCHSLWARSTIELVGVRDNDILQAIDDRTTFGPQSTVCSKHVDYQSKLVCLVRKAKERQQVLDLTLKKDYMVLNSYTLQETT